MEALKLIQQELNVPKNNFNDFGKYKYRSCEDILEAVKPLLGKYNAVLTISDEIVEISGRFYVKATAQINIHEVLEDGRIHDFEFDATAYAREPESKKGMDESQVTGAASSYARKYALCGLFAIDDTRDADTMDNSKNRAKNPVKKQEELTISEKKQLVIDYANENEEWKIAVISHFNVLFIEDLQDIQFINLHTKLKKEGKI